MPIASSHEISSTESSTRTNVVYDRSTWPAFPTLSGDSEQFLGAQSCWPFPEWLDKQSAAVQMLARLYEQPRSCPKCISPEAGMLLHALTQVITPKLALEVGSYLGVSTIWMASAMRNTLSPRTARLFGTDIYGSWPSNTIHDRMVRWAKLQRAKRHIAQSQLQRVAQLHIGDAQTLVSRVHAAAHIAGHDPLVGMAFIDGDHTLAGVASDLNAIEPVLGKGSCVVLHDVFPEQCGCDGPRLLLDHLSTHVSGTYEMCDLYTAPLNYGITVLRRLDGVEISPATYDNLQHDHDARVMIAFALARNLHPSEVVCSGNLHMDVINALASGMELARIDPLRSKGETPICQLIMLENDNTNQTPSPISTNTIFAMHAIRTNMGTKVVRTHTDAPCTNIDMCVIEAENDSDTHAIQQLITQLHVGGHVLSFGSHPRDIASHLNIPMQWCRLREHPCPIDIGQRVT